MAKVFTGIEIGARQVKIAQCENYRLCREIVEPLPDWFVRKSGGVFPEAMAEFLREIRRNYRLKDRRCCLILPDSAALTRRIKMPPMKEKHLKLTLPYEFHDFIRDRKTRWMFDYAVMGMEYGEDQVPISMDIMAAAVPEPVMEEYRRMIQSAGWKLTAAAPEAFAYSNIIREYEKKRRKRHPESLPGNYCFVDLGYRHTKIRFFYGECLEAGREIETGCEDLVRIISQARHVEPHVAGTYVRDNFEDVWMLKECREIYEKAGIELRKTLGYYQYRYPERTIQELYVCGGGSGILPFRETVAASVSLPIREAGDLIPVSGNRDREKRRVISPAAVGIAFQ